MEVLFLLAVLGASIEECLIIVNDDDVKQERAQCEEKIQAQRQHQIAHHEYKEQVEATQE